MWGNEDVGRNGVIGYVTWDIGWGLLGERCGMEVLKEIWRMVYTRCAGIEALPFDNKKRG